jgi:ribosomal-protein-alanine N-acetyltransferase
MIEVREAGAHDFPALAAIHAQCFADPWSESELRELCESGATALCGWERGALGGFAMVRAAAAEAEILTFAVSPANRRRGLATQILRSAIEWSQAEGAEDLFLEVAEDNAPAIALYAKLGFAERGLRPDYYTDGPGPPKTALVLALKIGE